jgi:hypothetical protein
MDAQLTWLTSNSEVWCSLVITRLPILLQSVYRIFVRAIDLTGLMDAQLTSLTSNSELWYSLVITRRREAWESMLTTLFLAFWTLGLSFVLGTDMDRLLITPLNKVTVTLGPLETRGHVKSV